jgi:hypothetical protein
MENVSETMEGMFARFRKGHRRRADLAGDRMDQLVGLVARCVPPGSAEDAAKLMAFLADNLHGSGTEAKAASCFGWALRAVHDGKDDPEKKNALFTRALVLAGDEPGSKVLVAGDRHRLHVLKEYEGIGEVGSALLKSGSVADMCPAGSPLEKWRTPIPKERVAVQVGRRAVTGYGKDQVAALEFTNGWRGEYSYSRLADLLSMGEEGLWANRTGVLDRAVVLVGVENGNRLGVLMPYVR